MLIICFFNPVSLYYKQEDNIVDQITIGENGTITFDAAILENFNETKLYSYGGIMADYFANLKHTDPDKFKKEFMNFKAKRFGLFDFNSFRISSSCFCGTLRLTVKSIS